MRSVELPDGRGLVIRPAAAADVAGLVELFERLSPDDRYRRFFSGYHPDEAFVEQLVSRPSEGGIILVAEVSEPSGPDIVAEAEYARLPAGDAELAMTVDRRWRGWLAAYLLDALLDVAAQHGIPSLRAEVLAQNRPMLSLLRSRGSATADTDDPCVAVLVIGACGPAPSWPDGAPHPRVLIEGSAGASRLASRLRDAGAHVLRCAGPPARPATAPCPALAGGTCPLAEGADVVVHALDRGDPRSADVLEAHRRAGTRVVEVGVGATDAGDDASIVARVLEASASHPRTSTERLSRPRPASPPA